MKILGAPLVVLLLVGGCHEAAPPPAPAAPAPAAPPQAKKRGGGDDEGDRTPTKSIQVTINGKPAGAWTPQQLLQVALVHVKNRNGETRDGWSLKDVSRALVGPSARIVGLTSSDGRVEIPAADWKDPQKLLVMRVSGRGDYKIQWVATNGNSDESLIRHVQQIDVAQ